MHPNISVSVGPQTFPGKVVSWEVVRNIANMLTNQLYLGGNEVDIQQAHMSSFGMGPSRDFTLEEGREGHWRDAGDGDGWHAFEEEDVSRLYWESMSSGNALEAVKESPNRWVLTYTRSPEDPFYRGLYFKYYEDPESVQNVDADYVYPKG